MAASPPSIVSQMVMTCEVDLGGVDICRGSDAPMPMRVHSGVQSLRISCNLGRKLDRIRRSPAELVIGAKTSMPKKGYWAKVQYNGRRWPALLAQHKWL